MSNILALLSLGKKKKKMLYRHAQLSIHLLFNLHDILEKKNLLIFLVVGAKHEDIREKREYVIHTPPNEVK